MLDAWSYLTSNIHYSDTKAEYASLDCSPHLAPSPGSIGCAPFTAIHNHWRCHDIPGFPRPLSNTKGHSRHAMEERNVGQPKQRTNDVKTARHVALYSQFRTPESDGQRIAPWCQLKHCNLGPKIAMPEGPPSQLHSLYKRPQCCCCFNRPRSQYIHRHSTSPTRPCPVQDRSSLTFLDPSSNTTIVFAETMRSQIQPIALSAAALVTLVNSTPIVHPFTPARRTPSLLNKRIVTGTICGHWPSADLSDNGRNSNNLEEKGGTVEVDGKSCNRIGCYNTSGVYVCNDNDDGIQLEMSEVVDHMSYLMRICIGPNGMGVDQVSGQTFTDGNWNLNIGYCNGNLSPSMGPAEYGGWPGPDGEPDTLCGWGDHPACDLNEECLDDTLIVDEQNTENCPDQEYMSASYVQAGSNNLYSTSRSVTEGWTVGGSIGIDTRNLQTASANAGFSASYSKTTTTGNDAGVNAPCGPTDSGEGSTGNYTCGLIIRPQCEHIRGTCTHTRGVRIPFEVYSPRVARDNLGVVSQDICTCDHCPDAENPDAPSICPLTCDTECIPEDS